MKKVQCNFSAKCKLKVTLRFHLTQVIVDIINKSSNNKCFSGCGRKGNLFHSWWECRLVEPPCKSVWRLLKELALQISVDPVLHIVGVFPKVFKASYHTDKCMCVCIVAQYVIVKSCKQPKCPSESKWIKKMWGIFCTMENHLATKSDILEVFVGKYMQLEIILLHEINWIHMYKYHIVFLVCKTKSVNKVQNK